MIATTVVDPPPRCQECRADEMGCQVKRGLGGRDCCDRCSHERRSR